MVNVTVDQKLEDISRETTQNLNGNQGLEDEIRSKLKSIIVEDEIKTSKQEIHDIVETILNKLEKGKDIDVEIVIKKARIELELWKKENVEIVKEYKEEVFKNKFEEEFKKINPDLTEKELNTAKEYSDLVAKTYYKDGEIDNFKDQALEFNEQLLDSNQRLISPGKLTNGWNDLKSIKGILKETPAKIKNIQQNYTSLKENLKNFKIPNFKEVRSFENVMSGISSSAGNKLFSRANGYLSSLDRINKLTGGWLNKTMTQAGQGLVSKIGNQATAEFAKNSLNLLAKEGFQKGFNTILNGILNGGVKIAGNAALTAGGAAASGGLVAAGAATGPPGWIVAAITLLKTVGDKIAKWAEKLGIGMKGVLEENFGKVGGSVVNGIISLIALPAILIGAISTVLITPIIIGVLVGLLINNQFLIGPIASTEVPPKGSGGPNENLVIPTRDPNRVVPEGCPSGWPANGTITRLPNDIYNGAPHNQSIDIANDAYTPIYASANGWAIPGYSCGFSLLIQGRCEEDSVVKDYSILYCHLIEPPLNGGEAKNVIQGQLVGNMGRTGESTGYHLHYQIDGLVSIRTYLPFEIDYNTVVLTDYGK